MKKSKRYIANLEQIDKNKTYAIEEAIEKIKQNSRHYAKRQMTWFNRNKNINWINASDSYEEQMDAIHTYLVGTR